MGLKPRRDRLGTTAPCLRNGGELYHVANVALYRFQAVSRLKAAASKNIGTEEHRDAYLFVTAAPLITEHESPADGCLGLLVVRFFLIFFFVVFFFGRPTGSARSRRPRPIPKLSLRATRASAGGWTVCGLRLIGRVPGFLAR